MKVTVKVDIRKDIARLKAAAGKDAPRVMKEFMLKHARALVSSNNKKFPGLIQVTPPLIKFGAKQSNAKAKEIGETAVSTGINRTYAGPGGVYGKMWEDGQRGLAMRFWKLVKAKKWTEASVLAQNNGYPGLSAWDGGAHHKQVKQSLSRGRIQALKGKHLIYLRERSGTKGKPPPSVRKYITKKQKLVGLLAGTILSKARAKFGANISAPSFVNKHANSSAADVNFSQRGSVITFSVKNTLPYQMKDLNRLYSWAGQGRLMAMQLDIKHAARALEKKLKSELASR